MDHKKNIVLVYPNNSKSLPKLPLSVLSLAGPLIKNGYNVIICDMAFDNYKDIDYKNVLFVGISSYTDQGIKAGLEIAMYVRSIYPDIPIVWGGPHPTILPFQTIKNPYVDIICIDEGEITIIEIAKAISNNNSLENIEGIIWKDEKNNAILNKRRPFTDLDSIEIYPYQIVDTQRYHWSLKENFYYETSRGCPYFCTFCSFDTNKFFRAKSPTKVVDDLEYITNKFHPRIISFLDSEFFINKKRVIEICNELIKRKLNISWSANSRCNILVHYDDALIELLKQSGCSALCFGAESGSDKILRSLKKRITREQILETTKKLKNTGIITYFGFMCGLPGETNDDFKLTLSLIDEIKEINKEVEIGTFQIYTPYPGSELYETACKLGYPTPEKFEDWPSMVNISYDSSAKLTPWLTKKTFRKLFIATTLVRFEFMVQREREISMEEKIKIFKNSKILYYLYRLFNLFFIFSKYIRWKYRLFNFAYEWYIWRYIRNKFINYY